MRMLGWLAPLVLVVAACDDFSSFAGTVVNPGGSVDLAEVATPSDAAAAADLSPAAWRTEPSGTPEELNDVWGSGSGELWAVGASGVILRKQAGGSWTSVSSGASETLWAVWGSGATDVWMAGEQGRIISWDGAFHLAATDDKFTLYGGSGVTVVGASGTLYTRAGPKWTRSPYRTSSTLFGVWTGTSELWSVGSGGLITHMVGGVGFNEPSGAVVDLHGVWGDGAGTVIAVGSSGTTLRRTVSGWDRSDNPDGRDLRAVTGCGASGVWAVGAGGAILRSEDGGKSWRAMNAGVGWRLNGVWCSGSSDVYAVGAQGLIVHWGG